MEENINERLSELGTKILATTRNELYIHMRFLDVALSSFAYVIDPSVNGVGTDGMCMFYHPGALGGMYRQNRVRMNRAYLHMVLHCILHHVTRRKGRDKTLWNVLVPNRRIWLISMLGRYTMPVFLLHGFLIKWMEKSGFFHWSENVNLLIAAILSAGICVCLGNPWAEGVAEMKWRRRF